MDDKGCPIHHPFGFNQHPSEDAGNHMYQREIAWARIPTSGQAVSAEHSRIGSAMDIFSSVGQTQSLSTFGPTVSCVRGLRLPKLNGLPGRVACGWHAGLHGPVFFLEQVMRATRCNHGKWSPTMWVCHGREWHQVPELSPWTGANQVARGSEYQFGNCCHFEEEHGSRWQWTCWVPCCMWTSAGDWALLASLAMTWISTWHGSDMDRQQ